ncbi:hypothetical protein NVP1158O_60 [Vibrio phage 1.158.O._10N.261.45.E12]|nr:hypothetical protein NVP1100O_57 [Vibrio phage 1.100.O._10N.261.45.C3]AUR91287.1 hypothetical protein NVP1158O_60 [Vibrio phage 1.158.O._10N.261.45.E12]AUR92690.1 hypothetical protein NVP1175O_62 [Vibrio phage 1.175.O._10N.261.55.B3]
MISNSKQRKLRGEWKYLGSGVHESKYGDRIHSGGMILMASGDRVSLSHFPSLKAIAPYICIQGGSKRRGLMLFTEIAKPNEILAISRSVGI